MIKTRDNLKSITLWVIFWIALAAGFGGYIGYTQGGDKAMEYFSAYLVEKSLSVDNLFVFYMIFAAFGITSDKQRTILYYGIIGAIVFRGIILFSGVALIQQYHWLLYFFGAFLVYTGVKMLVSSDGDESIEDSKIIRLIRKLFPKLSTTLLVIIIIEIMDLMFAIDSIPAVLSISQDPLIVYSSNIMAILGLRSLYFLLAYVADKMYYLKHSISIILAFIGVKMLIEPFLHISTGISLGLIVSLLILGIVCSLRRKTTTLTSNI